VDQGPAAVRISWLGHATVVIEAGGVALITDPVLRSRVVHLRRHGPAPRPPPVAAVLLSHLHHDHLDLPSLRMVDAPVYGPPGTASALRRLRSPVHEVSWGEEIVLGGVRAVAVPAVHDGRRLPFSPRREDDAIGFVVEAEGLRAYFAGDTEVFEGMAEIAPVDVALVPIWGWGPRLGPGHMDPGEAAQALTLLRPTVAVPIHWGTFLPAGRHRKLAHLLHEPVGAFRDQAARVAPGVQIEVLEVGGSLTVAPRDRPG
jgi:L-ascorbate metabolism protein UlaG (beta-lactamase superfamily)